jgi:hypothetical protein
MDRMLVQLSTCIYVPSGRVRKHEVEKDMFVPDDSDEEEDFAHNDDEENVVGRKRKGTQAKAENKKPKKTDVVLELLALKFPSWGAGRDICKRTASEQFVAKVENIVKRCLPWCELDRTRTPCLEFLYEDNLLYRIAFGQSHAHLYIVDVGPNSGASQTPLWPHFHKLCGEDHRYAILHALARLPQEFLRLTAWRPIGTCDCLGSDRAFVLPDRSSLFAGLSYP